MLLFKQQTPRRLCLSRHPGGSTRSSKPSPGSPWRCRAGMCCPCWRSRLRIGSHSNERMAGPRSPASAVSPRKPRASARQCGTSADPGQASHFRSCASAWTSSDFTAESWLRPADSTSSTMLAQSGASSAGRPSAIRRSRSACLSDYSSTSESYSPLTRPSPPRSRATRSRASPACPGASRPRRTARPRSRSSPRAGCRPRRPRPRP